VLQMPVRTHLWLSSYRIGTPENFGAERKLS
jgi:hypothetical protein